MSRVMSIDYGDARIGIALTDPMQIIASGYKTLQNDNNILISIYEICVEKEVESIVIGMPYDADSKIGIAAKKVIDFTYRLKKHIEELGFSTVFYEEDERYTTIDAIQSMRDIKVKRNKKKSVVDQIAAANILKSFLENRSRIKFDFEKYILE
jgi:putative holliday junction resolvase